MSMVLAAAMRQFPTVITPITWSLGISIIPMAIIAMTTGRLP